MNHTDIEWVRNPDGSQGYSINPVKGLCPMACPYCYARRMYKRFKWNPELRFSSKALDQLVEIKKPSRIFIGSTMELFGDHIKYWWLKTIFDMCLLRPQHTFIFLTKQPQNLIKWSPFPENCWVGVSITDGDDDNIPLAYFKKVEAKVKFISFEPLLHWWDVATSDMVAKSFKVAGISWVIIGQQTPVKKATMPKMAWIQDILVAASNAGNLPVFMKNNLQPLLVGQWAGWKLRQELPGADN